MGGGVNKGDNGSRPVEAAERGSVYIQRAVNVSRIDWNRNRSELEKYECGVRCIVEHL